jgi:carboxypeptidase family protein
MENPFSGVTRLVEFHSVRSAEQTTDEYDPVWFREGSAMRALGHALLLFLVFLLLHPQPVALFAQSVGGTIRGRILDSSGGAVARAQVNVRDTEKGLLYQTLADSMGLYQLALPVGSYEMEVAAKDFALTKETGLALSVGQTITLDLTLQVGSARETVEVRAEAPLVDTSSGTLSGLVDRERLSDLPLNGRDFGNLAVLEPGVIPNNNGANSPFGGRWAGFMINGQIDQATLFLIDGSEINDVFSGRAPSGSSGVLLGLEGVQEFQVLLNNFKAEFGKNAGGVIHVATRSGTNQQHGSAFEFLRNSALDAKNFFDLPNGGTPPFRRNQFGGSLGGPLRKDRTFFFMDYEGLRERKAITAVGTVPTAAVRTAAISSVVPFLNLYPLPNGPVNPDGRTASLTSTMTQPAREDYGLGRVDHRSSDRNTLFGRVSIQDSFITPPFPSTPVPGFSQDIPHRNIYSLAGLNSVLGPNAINEFHFAFNRTFGAIQLPPPPNGLTISPVAGRDFGLIVVSGISNLGTQTFVRREALNLFELSDAFTVRRGRHSQKYGLTVQHYQANELRGTFFNGQYSFAGLDPFLSGSATTFIGVLGGSSAPSTSSPAGWRWTSYGAYAQDDFQVLPALTLNLGIRYEFSTSPGEVHGQIANLRSPMDPQITYGGQLFGTIARSWAPRFGFAWSPLGNRQASLRGGYGIFYNPLVVNMFANSRLVPPFVNTVSIPRAPFPNPLATGLAGALSTTGQSIDYDLSQPYTEQWNLQWQQQVSSGWVATAAYVGNRTKHLIRSLESNFALAAPLPDGTKFYPATSLRRNPNFGAIRGRSSDGNSWYDALQLTLEKRLSRGWRFQASYTWGKSLSTTDSSFSSLPSEPTNTQDPESPAQDKGYSAFDARQRLVTHLVWQVPKNPSCYNSACLPWFRVLGGWKLSAIASFTSGYPYTVIDGFNRSRTQQSDSTIIADRPNWNPDFHGPVTLGDPARWFNPAAFALAPAGFYGNVARNALIGPGFASLDFSLSKPIYVRELHQVEFRADIFNLFNHPNFATPSSSTGAQIIGGVIVFPDASGAPSGSAGQIFRTVADSRQIQFSLRYRF